MSRLLSSKGTTISSSSRELSLRRMRKVSAMIQLRRGHDKHQRHISNRLAAVVIAVSSILTLVSTGIQLYVGYRDDTAHISQMLNQVKSSYLNSLANSIWLLDEEQIKLQIKGIATLPDLSFVEVVTKNGQRFTGGRRPSNLKYAMTRELKITFFDGEGPPRQIGTLKLVATLEGAIQRLKERVLVILITNATRTFLFAFLILYVFNALITTHLKTIADHVNHLDMENLGTPLTLRRRENSAQDEFDMVVNSINRMSASLAENLAEIKRRKEIETRLVVQLREALRIRSEFIEIASHELRTPLTSMKLQLQLIEKNLAKTESERSKFNSEFPLVSQLIKYLGRDAERMEFLAENLIDYSKINSGKSAMDFKSEDLVALVRHTLSRFSVELELAKCVVNIHADSSPFFAEVNADGITRVLSCLIMNAIKYGRGKPIDVTVIHQNDSFVLRVTDHGIGISEQDKNRIFDRFQKAVTLDHYGGFGLGLYLAKEIVALHHGSISVESEQGKGASFFVTVPLRAKV